MGGRIAILSLLITDGIVITMDASGKIYRNGAVFIEGDRISDVGRSEDLRKKYRAETEVSAQRKVVIPGLINTHYHVDSSLFLGLGTDPGDLREWTKAPYTLRCVMEEEEAETAAMLSCLSNIKGGVTSAVFNSNVLRKDKEMNFDAMVKAVTQSGIRAIVAKLYHNQTYPDRDLPYSELVVQSENEIIAEYEAQVRKFNNSANGRIRIWCGPNGPQTTTPETLVKVHQLVEKHGLGLHTHAGEDEFFKKTHKMSPMEKFKELGVLGPNFHAVHCYHMSDHDIEIMAETGTIASHNPTSNSATASGVMATKKMLTSGVTISLGTDGPHCMDRTDMFEVMRSAAYLQRVRFMDASVFGNAALVTLQMATKGGAAAMNQKDSLGSIEVGKKADVVLVDANCFNAPILDPIANLVYLTSSSDVDTTIVDGKILMENKKVTFTDEDALRERAQESVESLLERAFGEKYRTLIHEYNYV